MTSEIASKVVVEKAVKMSNDMKKSQLDKMPNEINELDFLENGVSVSSVKSSGERDLGEVSSGIEGDSRLINKYPNEISEIDSTLNMDEVYNLPNEIEPEEINYPQNQSYKSEQTEIDLSETEEQEEKKGGSYRDVKKTSDGETHEVHHMPADSASNLEREDGPAIKMEKEDHRQTASCGSSREAREYREEQKALIEQGKFRDALQMDIDDIHEKFGDKYEDAIAEMLEYVDQLEQEGKI